VAVIVTLPVGLRLLVDRGAAHLTARAEATPLLIGAKGSPLELVLNSLYFETRTPPPLAYREVTRVAETGLATAIPIYTRFRAQDSPIVGTTPEYFEVRGLTMASGRGLAMLGECIVGSSAARRAGLTPGSSVVSSPESVFDLAGTYPLKMRVVGVLAPSGGADDRAVFVDLKTAWVIQGLAHGHEDLSRPEAATGVLSREGSRIVANASVRHYTEITPDNLDSFHFHGDVATYPVTGVIAMPEDEKAATLLRGRYLGEDEPAQIVRPATVMGELLETILTVRRYATAAIVGVGLATLATMALVFVLSLQLRRREIETMVKIGGSRGRILGVLVFEILGVLVAGLLLAAFLSLALSRYGETALRLLLLQA
jgi:putative ABC transport system permease protein